MNDHDLDAIRTQIDTAMGTANVLHHKTAMCLWPALDAARELLAEVERLRANQTPDGDNR